MDRLRPFPEASSIIHHLFGIGRQSPNICFDNFAISIASRVATNSNKAERGNNG